MGTFRGKEYPRSSGVSPGLLEKHFSQLLNYLKTTRKRLGLIINFGANSVEIRRIIN